MAWHAASPPCLPSSWPRCLPSTAWSLTKKGCELRRPDAWAGADGHPCGTENDAVSWSRTSLSKHARCAREETATQARCVWHCTAHFVVASSGAVHTLPQTVCPCQTVFQICRIIQAAMLQWQAPDRIPSAHLPRSAGGPCCASRPARRCVGAPGGQPHRASQHFEEPWHARCRDLAWKGDCRGD